MIIEEIEAKKKLFCFYRNVSLHYYLVVSADSIKVLYLAFDIYRNFKCIN